MFITHIFIGYISETKIRGKCAEQFKGGQKEKKLWINQFPEPQPPNTHSPH
jgi:hypothetical protein